MKRFISLISILTIIASVFALPYVAYADGEKIEVFNANNEIVYSEFTNRIDDVKSYISSDDSYRIVISAGNFTAGYIQLGSNTEITAQNNTNITAAVNNHIFYNQGLAKGYSSLENVKITGGVWTATSKKSKSYTLMRFLHAKNITITNCRMYGNYTCHLIELIACSDVIISGCTLYDKGSTVKNSVEEPLQIDICTKTTAPSAYKNKKSKYYDAAPCRNISIDNCKIRGSRGICANYAKSEAAKCRNYHCNITITNCKIEGKTAEAVALFNTAKITVKNNTIITRRKGNNAYSCGLNIQMLNKKASNLSTSKYPVNISSNIIKGGRQAVCMYTHVGGKWGKTTLKNNKLYCRNGKKNAYKIDKKTVKSLSSKGNKLYKW